MKLAPQIALSHATRKNEIWLTDFVIRDDSQRTKIMIVLDVFTRLPVVLRIFDSRTTTARQMVTHLNEASRGLRYPRTLWINAGLKIGSEELTEWAAQHGIETVYCAPTPQRRSIIERFLECLSIFLHENRFLNPEDLQPKLAEWVPTE